MFSILPYRPNNHMANRNFFNDFENDFFRPFFDGMTRAQNPMKVDVKEESDRYVLEADIPGVKKENLKVEARDGVLTIGANYDAQTEARDTDGDRYIYRERRTGSFSRVFNIEGIDEDGITAKFENGVLTLTVPKKEAKKLPEKHLIQIAGLILAHVGIGAAGNGTGQACLLTGLHQNDCNHSNADQGNQNSQNGFKHLINLPPLDKREPHPCEPFPKMIRFINSPYSISH
jgi:HSP20 family protein